MGITAKSLSAVENWITIFNQSGLEGLMTKKRGTAPNALLTREQKDKIAEVTANNKPNGVGLTGEFWNIPRLRMLVKKKFGKEYQSDESYRRLLHFCGLSYQKVEFVDKRRDEQKAVEFKKMLQTRLKKGAMSMWW